MSAVSAIDSRLYASMRGVQTAIRAEHRRFSTQTASFAEVQKIQRTIAHISRQIKVHKVTNPDLLQRHSLLKDDGENLRIRADLAAQRELIAPAPDYPVVFLKTGLRELILLNTLRFLEVTDHAHLAACCKDTCDLIDTFRAKNPLLRPKDPKQPRVFWRFKSDSYVSSPLLCDRATIDITRLMKYARQQEQYQFRFAPMESDQKRTDFLDTILPFCSSIKSLNIRPFDLALQLSSRPACQLEDLEVSGFGWPVVIPFMRSCAQLKRLVIINGKDAHSILNESLSYLNNLESLDISCVSYRITPFLDALCKNRSHLPKFVHLVLGSDQLYNQHLVLGQREITGVGAIPYKKLAKQYQQSQNEDLEGPLLTLHRTFGPSLEVEWFSKNLRIKSGKKIPEHRWRRIVFDR